MDQTCPTGFLPGIFFFFGGGRKSTVMQISFAMLIFLLFSDQTSGGGKVSEWGRKLPQEKAPPVPRTGLQSSGGAGQGW